MGRFYDLLDEWDKNLSDYGKENLSFGLPIALAQGVIKTIKLVVKTAKTGADYIRNSDWYKSQTKESKENVINEKSKII